MKIKKISNWKNYSRHIFTCYIYFSSGDIGIYRALWNLPGSWSVKVIVNEETYELKPLEKILYRGANSRTDIEVKLNYSNDRNYKPGIKILSHNFLNSIIGRKNDLQLSLKIIFGINF